MKSTFWNFDHSRSEHEVSLFRTEPHIAKSIDRDLFRNPGCFKTVLYSKLQSLLIENVIMLTLVENRRRVVQAVKNVIQRRAQQISTVPSTCTRRVSRNLRPGNLRPGNLRPGNLRPGNLRPGNLRPGNLRPGNLRPGNLRPGNLRPDGLMVC